MRTCAARKTEEELQSETGDEDRPEMEPEPQTNTELEGLFVCLKHVEALPFLMCLQFSHFVLLSLLDQTLNPISRMRSLSENLWKKKKQQQTTQYNFVIYTIQTITILSLQTTETFLT